MKPPTQAVLFCGGRGERLRPLTDDLPKPMAPILGRPFLEYLIEQLRDAGARKFLVLTGYRGEQIARHFGDGNRWNVRIQYRHGPADWETGQRLTEATALLEPRFLLMYGDNFAPVSFPWLTRRHHEAQCALTVTVAQKAKGNLRLAAGLVERYDAARAEAGLDFVEIGYMIAERDRVLSHTPSRGGFAQALSELAQRGQLAAFEPGCFHQSISEIERLRLTEAYLRPKKLILLDRDGVVNRKAPRGEYVGKRADFVWLEENLAGLEALARQGFEFILLSNQAGIGRGIVPAAAVEELHRWMIEELRRRGIVLRDVFVCPHHWENGCACRKPLPGMFFAAAQKHALRLDRTLYVGDDERDVLAAWRAGCPCLLLQAEPVFAAAEVVPWLSRRNLSEALPAVLDVFRTWHSAFAEGEVQA